MKQQITRFEKSTPRLLAFVLMGVGLIGLGLVQASEPLGFDLAQAGAWVMLLGFVGATVFFFLMGSAPVAVGADQVDVEDRVQVQLSDELQSDIKAKLDAAIEEMKSQNTEVLSQFAEVTEGLVGEVEALKNQFAGLDLDALTSSLTQLSQGIDIDSTMESLNSLQSSVTSVSSRLDDLNNLSTTETEKLENLLSEIRENFDSVNKEVQVALKQFEGFNSEA